MSEGEVLTAVRALFPALMALSSLALVPLLKLWRGPERDGAAIHATAGVQVLLLATSIGAALAGAGYLSTLKIGQITIDPSEPGRLLVTLGGIVFAVIVGSGEGRRASTMGQIALFGIAASNGAPRIDFVEVLMRHDIFVVVEQTGIVAEQMDKCGDFGTGRFGEGNLGIPLIGREEIECIERREFGTDAVDTPDALHQSARVPR